MTVQLVPALPDNVIGIIAKGEVHADDYEGTIRPAIEAALDRHDRIRLLYVLGDDFEGFSAGAAREDSALSKLAGKFERIAVVTDHTWIRHSIKLFGHLMPGDVRVFSVAEEADASEWLTSP